jgi:membrane fusion protein, multidrug efflux system
MTRARRVWLIAAIVFAVAIAAAILIRFPSGSRAAAPKAPPAVTVSTAPVVVKSTPVKLYAIGNVEPDTSVAVRARVDGEIVAVRFKEGDPVRKGAVLFELDSRPFKASLDQAQANLAKDRAQLERANAQETRYQDLLRQKFISPDAYEQVKATAQSAAATVRADQAAIETAELQLGFCTIRSPLDGYAGRIQIQQGNLVRANDANPLVTVNKIIPVDVSFAVPEQNIDAIRRHQAAGDLVVQAQPPGGAREPLSGRLVFVDNAADMTTGTIKLKAEFPNTGTELWPGQFVTVALTLYEQKDAIVAPSAAIQNGPNGQYVFVVRDDMTAELRNIKVARAEGNDTVVASGLKPGERVVTVGQLRLAPGTKVAEDRGAKAS